MYYIATDILLPENIAGIHFKKDKMKHLPLNPEIFVQNRERFVKKMLPNSIAIFNSNDELPANGDSLHAFKQNSDLYWLTGIQQEDTMLIPGFNIEAA